MSKTTPIHEWEVMDVSDDLAGKSWTVQSEHHGHTMRVIGRIVTEQDRTSMFVVECSCGERFRMAQPTIAKHV